MNKEVGAVDESWIAYLDLTNGLLQFVVNAGSQGNFPADSPQTPTGGLVEAARRMQLWDWLMLRPVRMR
ncbi:MAG: hypothetical protein P4M09_00180 [Devosia sp.]|nr:hypothetical protein [Devosia sp.]